MRSTLFNDHRVGGEIVILEVAKDCYEGKALGVGRDESGAGESEDEVTDSQEPPSRRGRREPLGATGVTHSRGRSVVSRPRRRHRVRPDHARGRAGQRDDQGGEGSRGAKKVPPSLPPLLPTPSLAHAHTRTYHHVPSDTKPFRKGPTTRDPSTQAKRVSFTDMIRL